MIKKRITQLIGLGLVTTLLFTTVACQKEENQVKTDQNKEQVAEESKQEDGEFDPRSVTEGVTLRIAVSNHPRIEDYNTNDTTLKIEEALGVDLQFEVYASDDYQSKLNAMVATGEKLPDIMFDCGVDNINSWAAEGAVVDLKDWFEDENYAANTQAACKVVGDDILTYIKNADGNMYYVPSYQQALNGQYWQQLWIYDDWMKELGADYPTTTEEFYELAKLVSETDLNGNGKADEYILSGAGLGNYRDGWFDFMMSPFVYAGDERYLVSKDGELSLAYMTDEWKEGLKYIKRFFDEGLIPQETLTQGEDQWTSIRVNTEETTVLSIVDWFMNSSSTEYNLKWNNVPALKGPEGLYQCYYLPCTPYSDGAVITTDCENPLAAFLVLDYMCNEELSTTSRFGKRGVNWDYFSDLDIDKSQYTSSYDFMGDDGMYIIKYDDTGFWNSTEVQNVSYLQNGPFIIPARSIFGTAVEKDPKDEETKQKIELDQHQRGAVIEAGEKTRCQEVVTYLPMTTDELESVVDSKTEITKYLYESIGAFLTGAKDIDAEWDNYKTQMKKLGADELLQVYQTAWDRVVK